jgi:hypothetical protein
LPPFGRTLLETVVLEAIPVRGPVPLQFAIYWKRKDCAKQDGNESEVNPTTSRGATLHVARAASEKMRPSCSASMSRHCGVSAGDTWTRSAQRSRRGYFFKAPSRRLWLFTHWPRLVKGSGQSCLTQ